MIVEKLRAAADFKAIESTLVRLRALLGEGWQFKGKPIGVIVETRNHPLLDKVIAEACEILGIHVLLLHSAQNKSIQNSTSIQRLVQGKQLSLLELFEEHLTARSYNALLLSKEFWRLFCSDSSVLIFQTDAGFFAGASPRLKHFLRYDYVGSSWRSSRPIGLRIQGGSGGLSLRKVSAMIVALEIGRPELWPGGEDGYFAHHLRERGRVAGWLTSSRFGIQSFYWGLPAVGYHQPYRLHGFAKFMLKKLASQEIRFLEIPK